jgi:chromosome segregation ATPase
VGGAAVVIAGPHRIAAVAGQATSAVQNTIDRHIDDPIKLRSQLATLEAQYPKRIAEVRGDLAELTQQTTTLAREMAVSQRVIELASADMGELNSLLTRAESAKNEPTTGYRVVRVRFDNRSMDLGQAYAKANSIGKLQHSYETRLVGIQRDLGLLGQQESRLTELLVQLETERTDFQAQIWQLEQQVDTIARNDRMIDLLDKREKAMRKYDSYTANSLDQVHGNIAKVLAEQEGRLQMLAQAQHEVSYKDKAEHELNYLMKSNKYGFETFETPEPEAEVIEIGPDTSDDVVASRF